MNGATNHTSPTTGITPAIWVDSGNASYVAANGLYAVVTLPTGHLSFFDKAEFAASSLPASYPVQNVTKNAYYTTIQAAVTDATAGDTITVAPGTHVVDSQITINKAITLQGQVGAKIQVSGTGYRFLFLAGGTLSGFEIEKTDKSGVQNIIGIQASNVTISDNVFHGQYVMGDNDPASRAMEVSGGYNNISITGNTIYSLRQPAYINGPTTGTVSNNYVYGTRGWVLQGGNLTFEDNTWGTGADANVYDIAILSNVGSSYYTDVPAMSAANNNAFIEDQRTSPALLTPVYVDASAPACTSDCGTARAPYNTIQAGINRVVPGGIVNVLAGTYTENLTIDKALTLQSTNWEGKIIGTGAGLGGIDIKASNVTLKGLDISNPGGNGINLSNDQATPHLELSNISILNNKIHDIGGTLGGNTKAIKVAHGPDYVTIEDNQFYNIDNVGSTRHVDAISIGDSASTDSCENLIIRNNTFVNITGKGDGKGVNAISINNNTSTKAIIEGNSFEVDTINNTSATGYTRVIDLGRSTPDTVIRNNTFFVTNPANVNPSIIGINFDSNPGASSVAIENNKFLGGGYPLINAASYAVDASPNWFGQETGPAANQILNGAGLVTIPWCTDAACTTFGYPPVHNVTKDTYYATIQAAIDAAADGDVINVAAGEYAEIVTIDKPLTLLGPNNAINPNTGTRGAEATIVYPAGEADEPTLVSVVADDVTISGFTLNGKDFAGTLLGEGIVSKGNNLTVTNNIVKNFKRVGIRPGAPLGGPYYTNALIENNKVFSDVPGIFFEYSGIYLQGTQGVVRGNVVNDAYRGLQIQPYTNPSTMLGVVENNSFTAYKSPAYFNYSHINAADWVFRNNILTGYESPEPTPVDVFAGIIVQNYEGGNVLFEKNQIYLGTANGQANYLYYEIAPLNGTRSASPNYWGASTGPAAGMIAGDVDYLPYCLDPECTQFSKADLYMKEATIPAACGGQYEVEVWVDDVYDFQSYDLKLKFDHERIQIVKVENGTLLTGSGTEWFGNDLGNDDGMLSWGWAPTGVREVAGSGSLIKITFKPTNVAGDSTFTILSTSLLNNWPDADDIPFEITGGATVSTASIVTNTTQSKSYCDLATAVAQANPNETLRADVDFTSNVSITIDKALTLDTNNKTISRTVTISGNNNSFLVVPGGDLTIDGGGTITTTTGNAVLITGGAGSPAKAKLVNATLYGPNLAVGVVGNDNPATHATPYPAVFEMVGGKTNETVLARGNGAELIISGGTMTGAAPIMGNGTNDADINNGGTKITISGDAVIGSETLGWVAIYQPQDGELNINGGTIKGYNGVEMKAGTLNITGGTINAYGAYAALPGKTGNGTTNTGDAILVYSRDGYGTGTMNVNISGTPTITSVNGYALREFTHEGETSRLNIATISGGHFTGGTPGAVFFTTNTDANLDLTGGDYSTDPIAFVYTPYGTSLHADARWYISNLPVLTSTTFDDPVTLGVGSSFTLTINPSVPGTFNMVFEGYPSETEITYNGVTYTCVGDPCVITIPVTLTGTGPETLDFSMVVATGGTETPLASYPVTATLHAPAPDYGTTGRDLAHLDATVVVNSGFEVTGTFSMQGRTTTKAGIPVTLTWNNTFGVVYGPSKVTTEDAVNFNLAVNYGGSYTLTTLQPRYLNVYAGLGKTFSVSGPRLINSLWLRAGNAVWRAIDEHGAYTGLYDNEINGADASQVGSDWTTGGSSDPQENGGDVNFDGTVNIKDLTLVGGNMDLTSEDAYTTWMP